jgi:hypothetical protein
MVSDSFDLEPSRIINTTARKAHSVNRCMRVDIFTTLSKE